MRGGANRGKTRAADLVRSPPCTPHLPQAIWAALLALGVVELLEGPANGPLVLPISMAGLVTVGVSGAGLLMADLAAGCTRASGRGRSGRPS